MAKCEICGNDYDKAFTLRMADGSEHVFDSFECAVHAVAPTCRHCGCRILGHGHESDGVMYCCAHCATASGEHGLVDRVDDGSIPATAGTSGQPTTRPPADS